MAYGAKTKVKKVTKKMKGEKCSASPKKKAKKGKSAGKLNKKGVKLVETY